MRRRAAQRVLKQPPDEPAAPVLRLKRDVLPVQHDAAFVHIEAARDRAEQRGFSRAVGADDGHKFARVQMERKVMERGLFVDRARIEGFPDVPHLKHFRFLPSAPPPFCA